MGGPAQYLHIGFILISLANLIVIALLVVVFILAATLRRPEKHRIPTIETVPDAGKKLSGDTAGTEVRP
jgi:hypothetical protein